LPELASARATLRELQLSDASSLLSVLKKPEMRSFVADEPDSLDGVEKFIEWTHRGRRTGRHLCYGVVPAGGSTAVGLFQVSSMDPMGRTVEWGFMLDRSLWGCALLQECAGVLVDFVVEALGVQRLEARVAVSNARGTAALHRLGAVREAILRQCFLINGVQTDHAMWSILASDWNALRPGGEDVQRVPAPASGTTVPSLPLRPHPTE